MNPVTTSPPRTHTAEAVAAMLQRGGGRVLSVRRPWAHLIIDGNKTIENRSWSTRYRGLVVIHAGVQWDGQGADRARTVLSKPADVTFYQKHAPSGYIGIVWLTDIHPAANCCPPWGSTQPDMWHWVLRDPIRFAHPINGLGQLGLYRVPRTLHSAVVDAVGRQRLGEILDRIDTVQDGVR